MQWLGQRGKTRGSSLVLLAAAFPVIIKCSSSLHQASCPSNHLSLCVTVRTVWPHLLSLLILAYPLAFPFPFPLSFLPSLTDDSGKTESPCSVVVCPPLTVVLFASLLSLSLYRHELSAALRFLFLNNIPLHAQSPPFPPSCLYLPSSLLYLKGTHR